MTQESSTGWGSPRTPEQLGHIVALRRRQVALTQTALAQQAGVPRRFVNELEGGQATIYVRRLFATLDALGYRVVLEPKDGRAESDIPPPAITNVGW